MLGDMLLNMLKNQENQLKTIISSRKNFCFKISNSKYTFIFLILPEY